MIYVCVHSHQHDKLLQKSTCTSHTHRHVYVCVWFHRCFYSCQAAKCFLGSRNLVHIGICVPNLLEPQRGLKKGSKPLCFLLNWRQSAWRQSSKWGLKTLCSFSLVVKWRWSTRVVRNKLLQDILWLTWKVMHILTVLIRKQMKWS